MKADSWESASGVYLTTLLLSAAFVCPPPFSIAALILAVLQAYAYLKRLRPGLRLASALSGIFFAPALLEPSTGWPLSVVLMAPALPFLNSCLRRNALGQGFRYSPGRRLTDTGKTLTLTLLTSFVASLILMNPALIGASALLLSYVFALMLYALRGIPRTPLEPSRTRVRALVGESVEAIALLRSRVRAPMHVFLESPYPCVSLKPPRLLFREGEGASVEAVLTPTLAGPSTPHVQALILDALGLVQTGQVLEPFELHVIPRAKYAEWLAKRYLERTAWALGPLAASLPPPRAFSAARRGVEFYGGRLYQPGDSLRDVDWRHTFKLHRLVVKEYAGAYGQPTVLAFNLSAADPEEADALAYEMISSSLTAAIEAIPTALAAYNLKDIVEATALMNPREALKTTLRLSFRISLVKTPARALQPPDPKALQRLLRQLREGRLPQAERLAGFLELEHKALKEAARGHPATLALEKVVGRVPVPATVTVVSPWNYDVEALTMTLENLEKSGYSPLKVEVKAGKPLRKRKSPLA